MDRKIWGSILLSQILLLFIFPLNCNNYTKSDYNDNPFNIDFTANSLLAEILVESDADFIAYSFPGNGTQKDPYRIENFTISTYKEFGILVRNTTKHFVLQNNTVLASYTALKIEFAKPNTVIVQNNTALNSTIGFCNKFSDHVLIQNNHFTNNKIGASFNTLQYISFQDNDLVYNELALNLENNCSYSLIANNKFQYNNVSLFLSNSWECQIRDNVIRENGVGFSITTTNKALATTNCTIYANLFEMNEGYAITINSFQNHVHSHTNMIYHNSFVNNNLGGKQSLDDGFENIWNNLNGYGNFWSNWWGLGSYKIDGEARSKDNKPLENPLHETFSDYPKIKRGRVLVLITSIPLLSIVFIILHIQRVRRDTKLVEQDS